MAALLMQSCIAHLKLVAKVTMKQTDVTPNIVQTSHGSFPGLTKAV